MTGMGLSLSLSLFFSLPMCVKCVMDSQVFPSFWGHRHIFFPFLSLKRMKNNSLQCWELIGSLFPEPLSHPPPALLFFDDFISRSGGHAVVNCEC